MWDVGDIALCANKKCERRHECFRYMAAPNRKWQTYSLFDEKETEGCFEPILPDDKIAQKE